MPRFFANLSALHRFTLNLDIHRDAVLCRHCSQSGHLVAHGFVYKQVSMNSQCIVGKRIYCSNRHGRQGCGATTQLYLADHIPKCHYSSSVMAVFIGALLTQKSIHHAYSTATGQADSRHAYRWLQQLYARLIYFRHFIARQACKTLPKIYASPRLDLLLPTLQTLFTRTTSFFCPCYGFQLQHQISLLG